MRKNQENDYFPSRAKLEVIRYGQWRRKSDFLKDTLSELPLKSISFECNLVVKVKAYSFVEPIYNRKYLPLSHSTVLKFIQTIAGEIKEEIRVTIQISSLAKDRYDSRERAAETQEF